MALIPPQPTGVLPGSGLWNDWIEKIRTVVNSLLTSIDWTIITGKPTTIAGYGITDAQQGVQFQDEGSNLGTSGTATVVNFTGAGVTASRASNTVTVNISSGGGGLSDADYGDVTVSGGGTVMTIDADVVSNTKLANMPANTIKGNNTGGSADPADLTASQVKTLLAITSTDVSDFSTAADARIAAASVNALSDVVVTAPSTGQVLKYNGTNWINDTDATGGGGSSATTVEVNLGATPTFQGKFTITDAGISTSSKLNVWQAPGPYTGKGTLADEAVMDPIECIAVPATGSATVYWKTKGGARPVFIPREGNHVRSGISALTPFQDAGGFWALETIGMVKGNVKFNYQIF